MDVTLIVSFDAFRKLKQPWNELSRQTPDDHAFMRHEWFEHWLSSQEMTSQLHMITAWQDGQLVGVLPLVWREVGLRGMRFRALRFAESPVSPRCNALVLRAEVLKPLVAQLTSERKCQLIELQHLDAESSTTQALMSTMQAHSSLLVSASPGRQSPYLMLDCSWDDYMKGLSGHRRAWIRSNVKKLDRCGKPYEFRFIRHESGAEFLVDAMLQVSSRSWKADAGTAIGQVPSQQRLYTEFTRVGLASGLVEAIVLILDGQPIAFDYMLRLGRRFVGIRKDYDKEFGKLQPGENLHAALIKDLGASGITAEVDFGGVVSDAKLRWTSTVRSHVVIHAAGPLWKGALLVLWKKVKAGRRRESGGNVTSPEEIIPDAE